MKRVSFLTLASFALPLLAWFNPSLLSAQGLSLTGDIARFRGDSSSLYVEVYYSFDVTRLKYLHDTEGLKSEAIIRCYFKRSSDDSVLSAQAWRVPFSAPDSSSLKSSRSYVDVAGFFLHPDIYRFVMTVVDRNDSTRHDSISSLVDLKPLDDSDVSMSDIELCTSILPADKDAANRYYKNTFEVHPNPSRLYGPNQPVLFYYDEFYHLLRRSTPTYNVKAAISNALGQELLSHEKIRRRMNESNVEVGMLKINTLHSGTYLFSLTVSDSSGRNPVSRARRFFVYNPSLPADTALAAGGGGFLASEYATMSEAEVDREFEEARYVATRDELSRYAKLSGVEAKRKMLYEFWHSRDDDPSTPTNEKKIEYYQRVEYANQNFRTGFKEGWKTDRGRVFIMYGPPDEVDRHANEIDTKPYEVWYYHSIQGGVEFDFGDRTGFSEYTLLNSTHRDELHDDNWMQLLQTH